MNFKPVSNLIALALITAVISGAAPSVQAADSAAVQNLVDINTASQAELESVPGIGPSKAQAVISFRSRHPFKKVEDIMKVKGIGRKTFLKLKPYLTVSAASSGTRKP